MKKAIFISFFILFSFSLFSQNGTIVTSASQIEEGSVSPGTTSKLALNLGILMGGGSLLGADLEYMPSSRLGLQAGMGISSFGVGLAYHLKDRINSSFISFQYWHQGFGDNHYASYVGPMFVYRAKKIFQAGFGFGAVVDEGPTSALNTKVVLLYNIGVYFPL